MATRTAERSPYGVGRLGGATSLLIIVLLGVVALGIYAYSQQLINGEIVTGMRDIGTMGGAAWGLYIAFVVYFVGVSFAGITIAAMVRLLDLEHLKPICRMAELLTVITLVLGAFSVLADLGQPLRGIINLFRYGRPMSPFFGTFSLVMSGYLFASLVYLYLAGRRDAALMAQRQTSLRWFYRLWAAGYRHTPEEQVRHHRTTFWLALAILPLLVTAHSTLGFVFGLQTGRPGWYSALQAPGFVVLAGVSGTGLLIVIAALLRQAAGAKELQSLLHLFQVALSYESRELEFASLTRIQIHTCLLSPPVENKKRQTSFEACRELSSLAYSVLEPYYLSVFIPVPLASPSFTRGQSKVEGEKVSYSTSTCCFYLPLN